MGHISREAVVACRSFIGMATVQHEERVNVLVSLTGGHLGGQTTPPTADR
jgi:hypothetical protein